MEREPENAEDIERLLTNARKALQEFEDGADWRRLLERVRTASPAHPVLMARFLFAASAVTSLCSAIGVMIVPMFNGDLARTLAAFDEVVPYVPEEIPALPSLLVVLALVMAVGWVFATWAAMSLGRDTTMLPWEQKQHQKLVNEVTRLTTQKAVMERIRATPAGARPRIATPVPVAARGRQPGPSGGASGAASGGGTSALSRRSTPSAAPRSDETPSYAVPAPELGGARGRGLAAGAAAGGGLGGGGLGSGGLGSGGLGAGGFGARARPTPPPVSAPEPEPEPTPPTGSGNVGAPAKGGGLLARAKSAGSAAAGMRPSAPPPPPPEPEPEPEVDEDEQDEIPTTSASLGYTPPSDTAGGVRLGGVRLGATPARPAPAPVDDFSDLVEVAPEPAKPPPAPVVVTPPAPVAAVDATPDGPNDAGILGRARAGTNHLRSTPYGAAGRIRPPPTTSSSRGPVRAAPTTPPEPEQPATRAGTPLGAAPRAGTSVRTATAPPASSPAAAPAAAAAASVGVRSALPGGMFGTPPPVSRQTAPPAAVSARPLGAKPAAPAKADVDEVTVMEEDEEPPTVPAGRTGPLASGGGPLSSGGRPPAPAASPGAPGTVTPGVSATPGQAPSRGGASAPPPLQRPFPRLGPINESWLAEAVEKAEKLQRSFPIQAHLELSQEPHLPFTLVIARATPAMAVRAMVNFVEFLAQISTPPRARIELVNIPHLDRSFHKNVEAALEPYFQGNVEVEPNPGRVDILFTDPDPQWGNWSTLPVLDSGH